MTKLRCTRCKEVKPESEFSFRYKSKGVRQSRCKSCCKTYGKRYYERNSDRWRQYVVVQRIRVKEEAHQFLYEYFLTHHCTDCGESDPIVLEFDHVNGEKDQGIAAMVSSGYRLERIESEVAKCEVRCRNCHIKRHSIENNIWIVQMIKAAHEVHGGQLMPSNEIKINGTVVYEVPDSFMGPLEAYLKMVQEKTGQLLEEAPESRRKLDGGVNTVPVQNDSGLQRTLNESLHMVSELTETLGPILRPDDRPTPEAMDSSPIVETAQAIHGNLEKLVRRVDL